MVGQEFVLAGGIGDLSSCAAPLEPTAVRDDVDVVDVGDPDWVQSLDAAAATGARPGQREACWPARQSEPPSSSCFNRAVAERGLTPCSCPARRASARATSLEAFADLGAAPRPGEAIGGPGCGGFTIATGP